MSTKYCVLGLLPFFAFGECTHLYGQTHCYQGTISHLNASGHVSMIETKVLGNTQVQGQLTAKGAQFSSLSVNGTAHLSGINAEKDIDVKGMMVMSHSKAPLITVSSNRLELHQSEVGEIRMRSNPKEIPTITLTGQSRVTGQIIFEQGQGRVLTSSGSSVAGPVIGGQIIRDEQ